MNRKEKIKLLEDLSEGRNVMKNQFPSELRVWEQDAFGSDIFRWGEYTWKKGQQPQENEKRVVINAMYYCCESGLEIREDED